MFYNYRSLNSINLPSFDTYSGTDMNSMFKKIILLKN